MRDIRINGHRIRMYDDIETLPVVRFHKYNKMLLLDAGIGSDLSDFAAHVQRAKHFARKGDDNALTELDNLLQNVMLIQQELSPRHLAFAVLVAEVDGVACGDLSDEGLRRTLERVQDISNSELSVDSFAQAMGMSRSVFYLNMKRVFGSTPNNFIQEARMARAKELLRTRSGNVSEVAYRCGFSDPKYFSRCFKKATGVSPSEYS